MDKKIESTGLDDALNIVKLIQESVTSLSKETLKEIVSESFDKTIKQNLKEDEEDIEIENNKDQKESDMDDENPDEINIEEIPDNKEDIDVNIKNKDNNEDDEKSEENKIIDLTNMDDDKGIEIFSKLTDDDELEVVGDGLKVTDDEGNEYLIKPKSLVSENYFDDNDEVNSIDDESGIDTSEEDEIIRQEFLKAGKANEIGFDESTDDDTTLESESNNEEEDIKDESCAMGDHGLATGMKQHVFNPDFPKERERADLRAEAMNRRLEKQVKTLKESNKKQLKVIVESQKIINEYKNVLLETHRVQTNLSNFKKIVNECVINNNEKEEVLLKLSECKNSGESNKIFEYYKNKFSGKEKEKVNIVTENRGTVIEKQSFIAPELKESAIKLMERIGVKTN